MKILMILIFMSTSLAIASEKKLNSEKILDIVNNIKVQENKILQISFKKHAAFYYVDDKNINYQKIKDKLLLSKEKNKKITIEVQYPKMSIVNVDD